MDGYLKLLEKVTRLGSFGIRKFELEQGYKCEKLLENSNGVISSY